MPAAHFLSRQGHQVWIDCPAQWHSIFDWVSYVRPWGPGEPRPDKVLDTRQADMTACRSTLINHTVEWFQELEGAPKEEKVFFDRRPEPPVYDLPARFILVSPFGYSQYSTPPADWIVRKAKELLGRDHDFYCLSDSSREGLPIPVVTARSVSHLPYLLAQAEEVVTINSAPNIISAAVRKSHFLVWDEDVVGGRTNYLVPHQVVVRIRDGSTRPGDDSAQRIASGRDRAATEEGSAYAEVWRHCLAPFVEKEGIRSLADLGCGAWTSDRLERLKDVLYYGVAFSRELIGVLRAKYGSARRIFYATDPREPELPNRVDLVILRGVLEGMERSQRMDFLRRICLQHSRILFVRDASPAVGSAAPGAPEAFGRWAALGAVPGAEGLRELFRSEQFTVFLHEREAKL
jgi:hypothetical protein